MRQAMGLTLGAVDGHVFTFARFSFYCILGMIESEHPRELEASHIKVYSGELPTAQYMTPNLGAYLIGLEREAFARAYMFAKKNDPEVAAAIERHIAQGTYFPRPISL